MTGKAKKLRRSTSEKVVAGVLGGLAEYFGVDVTIIRLIFVLVSIFSIAYGGLIIYVIFWAVMPVESSADHQNETTKLDG